MRTESTRPIWALSSALMLALFARAPSAHPARQAASPERLEKAIAALRHVDPLTQDPAKTRSQAEAIQKGWNVIRAYGRAGMFRLKRELHHVTVTKEQDDFFKLNACALLWIMGGLSEAQNIATVWNATPLHVQYNYVFFPAFEAAKTKDLRALPMLKACLRDTKGWVVVEPDSMKVAWPLTHEILWGTFGPKGLPALLDGLNTWKAAPKSRSVMVLLAKAQHIDALSAIRQTTLLAVSDEKAYRTATECLGLFGHPRDYEFLINNVNCTRWRPKTLRSNVFALAEYEDLRAVPHLVPLLRTTDDRLRRQVIGALAHLLTPESLAALHAHSKTAHSIAERRACKKLVADLLEPVGLTWARYAKKPTAERARLAAALRVLGEDAYRLKPDDRRLTRPQLVAAAQDWQKNGTITGGAYGWVYDRHILSVATADDIRLLLDVKAALYARLSADALSEIGVIDDLVRRIGRSRYRKVVGLTAKVEAK